MLKIKISQNITKLNKVFPIQVINKINKLFIKEKSGNLLTKLEKDIIHMYLNQIVN